MDRNPVAIAMFCAVAACSPARESSAGSPPGQAIQTAAQDVPQPEITAETIVRDVVGRVVKITETHGDSIPTEWTFDADEFKQVEILERAATPEAAAITVFM